MNPKQSLEWIKRFESSYDNLNYNICGVDCWPVVRNTLLSMVLPKSSQQAGTGYNISSVSLMNIARSILTLFSFKKSNVFILSDAKFSESISGLVYLKDAHVLSETARLKGESAVVALQNLSVDKAVVGREHCQSVFAILLLAASLGRAICILKFFPSLSRYVEIIFNEIASAPMVTDSSVSRKALKRQISRNILFCLVASKIFSLILKRVKPERAYVVCYYSALGMALCASCRKLGIPIVDIQHGVAGGSMRAYAGWHNLPVQGYTTLPDTFFCWTPFDAEAITLWAQRTTRHSAVVTGSLWREYILEHSLLAAAEKQWSDFFTKIKTYRKVVLITMQSSVIAPLFVDVMRGAGTACCFLIRTHPGFALEKDESYAELTARYPNVYFDQISDMPIQLILRYVNVHLTEWSGAVIDAYFQGVKSIVVSSNALDYFEEYINKGEVIFAPEAHEVLQHISK